MAEQFCRTPSCLHFRESFSVLGDWTHELHYKYLIENSEYDQGQAKMTQNLMPAFEHLSLERRDQVFIITLRRGEENRLNTRICNEVIKAFHYIQKNLGPNSPGAVITRGHNAKFWCTGVDQDERDSNPFANSDGFFPMIHTVLDFPYPTVALLTGHTFGGACPFALGHDYRVMNSERGFISMVCSTPIVQHALC